MNADDITEYVRVARAALTRCRTRTHDKDRAFEIARQFLTDARACHDRSRAVWLLRNADEYMRSRLGIQLPRDVPTASLPRPLFGQTAAQLTEFANVRRTSVQP